MQDLQALVAANEDAAAAIAAAYEMLLGGVPNIAGFEFLIENAIATNYGSNNPAIEFNQENIFINIANALVQGNPAAAASFAALTAGQASLSDKVAAIYNAVVPLAAQSEGGLAYVTRPDALAFYAAVAAERGVAGPDGAAIVALASILNIAYENDLGGIGDAVNDLLAAIADGSAQLPADGDTFTPIEVADGTNFDGDDIDPNTVTLTVNPDTVSGSTFNAPRDFTPGGTDQMNTLNDDDVLTGTGDHNVLNFVFVNDADTGDYDINPTLNNINEINVDVRLDGDGYLDLQDSTGVEEINVEGVDGTLFEAYNIQDGKGDGSGINLSVNDSNDEDSHVHFFFVDKALKGEDDVANLTVSNVTLEDIYVEGQGSQGFETLNLESTGAENSVGYIAVEEAKTINISGDEALTLGTRDDTVRASGQVEGIRYGAGLANVAGSLSVINASGLTASLDIAVGDETIASQDGTSGTPVDIQITGTGSDDTIRLLAGLDGKDDTVDGGAGADTIQVFASVTKGTLSNLEHLDIRGGQDLGTTADLIKVDTSLFAGLEDITIRNEGQDFVFPGVWQSSQEQLTTQLTNLSAELAQAITVQHSTTGSNGLDDNIIVAQLKTDTANDTVKLSIVDQNDGEDRGINVDPRFNVQLQTAGVENITLNDTDSESNTVQLGAGAIATDAKGGGVTDITGTLTLIGGRAGQFLNLDTGNFGGAAPAGEGIYDLDATGGTEDEGDVSTGPAANVLNNGGAATRFSAAKIDATAYEGDVIVRVDTLRNADGVAQAGGAQTILMGKGNDTVIFDFLGDTTAGLTISDTVSGGEGNDTLVIDGNGVKINISASEWTNVSGFENIRLVGNGVGGTNDIYGKNSYNLTLTNDLITNNGEDVGGGRRINIINDNDLTDGVNDTGTGFGFANRGVTIDARSLDAQHSFAYDGAEGGPATADRFIMADANINGMAIIDGGAVLGGGNAPSNLANSDVLEVRNSAVVTTGDLANISNVGTIAFTNDSAAVQSSVLQLNDAVVEALVNTSQTASAGLEETLTITATDNPLVPGAFTQLTIDATQVTSAFLQLNITGGGGVDTITGGAGNDIINGGAGNDIIDGGAGNDQLFGGTGNDTINGGAGNDLINAGPGNNVVTGGAGADTFQFNNGDSVQAFLTSFTIITDFNSSEDKIDVTVAVAGFGSANGAAAANLAAANALVNFAAAEAFLVFNYNNTGDSFLYIDTNNDGAYQVATDGFIQLTGVTSAAGFDISDFV